VDARGNGATADMLATRDGGRSWTTAREQAANNAEYECTSDRCDCESALAPADNSIGAPETGLMLEDPNAKIWFGSGAATCSLGLDATKSALVASCPIVGSSSAGSGRRMAQMEADNEALAKKYEALGTEKEAQYKAYKALAYKYEALGAENKALAYKYEALGAENKALAYKYEARRAEEEAQYKALAKKIEALAAENAALKA